MRASKAQRDRRRGATAVQLLVIFVPVLLGFMGFAVDLGRLYLVRGELKTAANAMALAAAQRLAGTDASSELAGATAQLAIVNTGGFGNKYDFGGVVIGEGSGVLASATPEPSYYDTVSAATGEGDGGGSESGGAAARYVRVDVTAEAPLIFWSFLSLGQQRKTAISARAVAGMSAPLCTACGIEPIAIQAIDASDATEFGFTKNNRYTFGFFCNGNPQPGGLGGAPQRIQYLLLNRLNDEATLFPDESSQLFRMGAAGLPPNSNPARACFTVNASEQQWASATPLACNANRAPEAVINFACGIANRFDVTPQTGCTNIPEVDAIASAFTADTDVTNLDDYAAYTGTMRRIITVPIVEILVPGGTMTILGFRQFLVQPNLNDVTTSPNDANGRFVASYIGSVVPLRQGTFGGCSQTAGPGKVVLHQ
jgi:Flp pilus assembly protein TadG